MCAIRNETNPKIKKRLFRDSNISNTSPIHENTNAAITHLCICDLTKPIDEINHPIKSGTINIFVTHRRALLPDAMAKISAAKIIKKKISQAFLFMSDLFDH